MAKQFNMVFIPDYQASKLAVTQADVLSEAGAANLCCGFGDNVTAARQSEIDRAFEDCWAHMRDSNQLSSASGPLYVKMNIDTRVATQHTAIVDMTADDVFIGVGANVNAAGENASQMHDSGFRMLREWAKENYFVFN